MVILVSQKIYAPTCEQVCAGQFNGPCDWKCDRAFTHGPCGLSGGCDDLVGSGGCRPPGAIFGSDWDCHATREHCFCIPPAPACQACDVPITGAYTMTEDLGNSTDPCCDDGFLLTNAPSNTGFLFDCAGYTVWGDSVQNGYTPDYGIKITNLEGMEVKNCTVRGFSNNIYQTGAASDNNYYHDNNLTIDFPTSAGYFMHQGSNITIENSFIQSDSDGKYGIFLSSTTDNVIVDGNTIDTTAGAGYGLYVQASTNATFINNYVDTTNNGPPLYLRFAGGVYVQNTLVHNNTFIGGTHEGIKLQGSSCDAGLGHDNNTFTNNYITSKNSGYENYKCNDNNVFSGNTVAVSSIAKGVEITYENKNTLVSNNNITAESYGIYMYSGNFSGTVIDNNTITTSTSTDRGFYLRPRTEDVGTIFLKNNYISVDGTNSYAIDLYDNSEGNYTVIVHDTVLESTGTNSRDLYVAGYSFPHDNEIYFVNVTFGASDIQHVGDAAGEAVTWYVGWWVDALVQKESCEVINLFNVSVGPNTYNDEWELRHNISLENFTYEDNVRYIEANLKGTSPNNYMSAFVEYHYVDANDTTLLGTHTGCSASCGRHGGCSCSDSYPFDLSVDKLDYIISTTGGNPTCSYGYVRWYYEDATDYQAPNQACGTRTWINPNPEKEIDYVYVYTSVAGDGNDNSPTAFHNNIEFYGPLTDFPSMNSSIQTELTGEWYSFINPKKHQEVEYALLYDKGVTLSTETCDGCSASCGRHGGCSCSATCTFDAGDDKVDNITSVTGGNPTCSYGYIKWYYEDATNYTAPNQACGTRTWINPNPEKEIDYVYVYTSVAGDGNDNSPTAFHNNIQFHQSPTAHGFQEVIKIWGEKSEFCPLEGALVNSSSVPSSPEDFWPFSELSDSDGRIEHQAQYEYYRTPEIDSVKAYYTNYTYNATKDKFLDNSSIYEVDDNKFLNITLLRKISDVWFFLFLGDKHPVVGRGE